MTGEKHDDGKPELRLLPWAELTAVTRVLEYGARKYAEGNWRHVPNGRNRYLNAALRHLAAVASGEDLDPESGLPHAAHAACSALFLIYFPEVEKT